LNHMLFVMLWTGCIDLQVSLLHQVFVGRNFSTRLKIDLIFKLLHGLILNLDERVMILLQAVLILIKLFFILIKLNLSSLKLLAHFLFLFLKLRMLLHKWLGLLKLITLLLLLFVGETHQLIVKHMVTLGILIIGNNCELIEILLNSWFEFLLEFGDGFFADGVGIDNLVSELDFRSNSSKVIGWY
jgi:hypothetical protein